MNLPSVIPHGYRRITAKLAEHWAVNRKRVQRLWRAEGLKVPTDAQTNLSRDGENACHRQQTRTCPSRLRSTLDDTTLSGGRLFLTVVDHTCLSINVERSLTGSDVAREPSDS